MKIINNSLILILVFVTLNCSVSFLDLYQTQDVDDMSITEVDFVDTVFEYLVENVLGFSYNTFSNTSHSHGLVHYQSLNHFRLKWNLCFGLMLNDSIAEVLQNSYYLQNDHIYSQWSNPVIIQPPRI